MQHLAHFGAGLGPQELREHAPGVVKCLSPAGYSNQFESLQERKEGNLQECRTARLEGLQGCKIARLEDWKGFKAVNLQDWKTGRTVNLETKCSSAWWPLKGPADIFL